MGEIGEDFGEDFREGYEEKLMIFGITVEKMKCGYTITSMKSGPKGGITAKTWRCSRKGIHLYEKSDPYYNGKPCMLCTQHLKKVNAKQNENDKR